MKNMTKIIWGIVIGLAVLALALWVEDWNDKKKESQVNTPEQEAGAELSQGEAQDLSEPTEVPPQPELSENPNTALLAGEYDLSGTNWHLSISGDRFSIYDKVGNPGVEGSITECTKDAMTVEVDMNIYEQLPYEGWALKDDCLKMSYLIKDYRLILANNNLPLIFDKEEYDEDGNLIDHTEISIDDGVWEKLKGEHNNGAYVLKFLEDGWERRFAICSVKESQEVVSGKLVTLDEKTIAVKWDGIAYALMPQKGCWVENENGQTIIFSMNLSGRIVTLSNNGYEMKWVLK